MRITKGTSKATVFAQPAREFPKGATLLRNGEVFVKLDDGTGRLVNLKDGHVFAPWPDIGYFEVDAQVVYAEPGKELA